MEDRINKILAIKETILRFGKIDSNKHYELNNITNTCSVNCDNVTVSVYETDFKFKLSVKFDEVYRNEYYFLAIDYYKFNNQIYCIGTLNDSRGNWFEKKLNSNMRDETIFIIENVLENLDMLQVAQNKVIDNFRTSVTKILTTDIIYKENISNFGRYPNGGAFIGSASETNINILERLNKYPKVIDWVEPENIRDLGFNDVNDLMLFIFKSEYFEELKADLLNKFKFEPLIFLENNILKFSCRRI